MKFSSDPGTAGLKLWVMALDRLLIFLWFVLPLFPIDQDLV